MSRANNPPAKSVTVTTGSLGAWILCQIRTHRISDKRTMDRPGAAWAAGLLPQASVIHPSGILVPIVQRQEVPFVPCAIMCHPMAAWNVAWNPRRESGLGCDSTDALVGLDWLSGSVSCCTVVGTRVGLGGSCARAPAVRVFGPRKRKGSVSKPPFGPRIYTQRLVREYEA